jgi:hypothetical protein
MSAKPLIMMVALCLLLCFAMLLLTSDAHAQGSTDTKLGNKEWDENKLPGKKEFAIAGFSVLALIGVIKYF